MRFSISAKVGGVQAMFKAYHHRLQQDGDWRKVASLELGDNDLVLDSLNHAVERIPYDGTVKVNGIEYSVNPQNLLGQGFAHVEPIVHRVTKPHLFTKSELIMALVDGDDKTTNCLYLDLEGQVHLGKFSEVMSDYGKLKPVAVIGTSLTPGEDCVGWAAASDEGEVNNMYFELLVGWLTHLMKGETYTIPTNPDIGNKDILEEIEELTAHLK